MEPPEPRIHEEDVLGARDPQDLDALIPVALEPGSAVQHEDLFGGHGSDARRRTTPFGCVGCRPQPPVTVPRCPSRVRSTCCLATSSARSLDVRTPGCGG